MDEIMEPVLEERRACRGLDMSKLKNRRVGTISSEEALKDVAHINWTEEVLDGKTKVVIRRQK